MPYCLKCGAQVVDTVTFCPNCGTRLKDASAEASTPAPSPEQKASASEGGKPAKTEPVLKFRTHTKRNFGFLKYLDAGLILITFALYAIFEISNPRMAMGINLTLMLLTMGLIVICSLVIYVFFSRRGVSPAT